MQFKYCSWFIPKKPAKNFIRIQSFANVNVKRNYAYRSIPIFYILPFSSTTINLSFHVNVSIPKWMYQYLAHYPITTSIAHCGLSSSADDSASADETLKNLHGCSRNCWGTLRAIWGSHPANVSWTHLTIPSILYVMMWQTTIAVDRWPTGWIFSHNMCAAIDKSFFRQSPNPYNTCVIPVFFISIIINQWKWTL